jgi:hypothetical protein
VLVAEVPERPVGEDPVEIRDFEVTSTCIEPGCAARNRREKFHRLRDVLEHVTTKHERRLFDDLLGTEYVFAKDDPRLGN